MTSTVPGKVSIVLPVRHVHREWLIRSIESVLAQDYEHLELIVVNDETTEDIDELVRSLGVHKYVKNDRNRKLPYSLNRGFEVAEGEYHTWTSADNYMLPGMITRLVTELSKNPDAAIVFGRSVNVDQHDAVLIRDHDPEERLARLTRCDIGLVDIPSRYTYISTLGGCFLYRSEVWKMLGGYDETLHGAEDYDFWIRASRCFRIRRLSIKEPALYTYRVHDTSISNNVVGCFTRLRVVVLLREIWNHPTDFWLFRAVVFYAVNWIWEIRRRVGNHFRGFCGVRSGFNTP